MPNCSTTCPAFTTAGSLSMPLGKHLSRRPTEAPGARGPSPRAAATRSPCSTEGARPVVAEPQVAAAVGPPLCTVATLAPADLSTCSLRDLARASPTRCAPMAVRLQR
eukprot:749696-Pyramimonas_sp.AAC.1